MNDKKKHLFWSALIYLGNEKAFYFCLEKKVTRKHIQLEEGINFTAFLNNVCKFFKNVKKITVNM